MSDSFLIRYLNPYPSIYIQAQWSLIDTVVSLNRPIAILLIFLLNAEETLVSHMQLTNAGALLMGITV